MFHLGFSSLAFLYNYAQYLFETNMNTLRDRTEYFLKKGNVEDLDEIKELQHLIREHNRLYHSVESPIVSDFEYDQLFRHLRESEEKFGVFDVDSPTRRIDVLVSQQFQK